MSSVSTPKSPAFDAGDSDQTVDYHSLSVLAILGMVLGLLSPLCFGATLLILIPIAGAAVSILALHRIAVSEGALAGRWAAYLGLIASTAMLVAPISRGYIIKTVRIRQAREFGRDWLEMVAAGKVQDAFRLLSSSSRLGTPPEPGDNSPPPDRYDTFRALPTVKAVSALGADAVIRYGGVSGYDAETFPRVFINQQFDVAPAGKPESRAVKVQMIVERTRLAKEGRSRWIVWSIDDGTKPPSTSVTKK